MVLNENKETGSLGLRSRHLHIAFRGFVFEIYKTGPLAQSASACQGCQSYQRRPNKPVNAMLAFR